MRWLKHLTETRQDEKIARLLAKGGHAAYGLWWMVLETVARQIEKGTDKCSVTYPASKWAVELQTTPNNVRKRLTVMVTVGLLQMNCKGSDVELIIPNLLKYRDEYQSKIGSLSRARTDTETEQKQKQSTDRASRAGKNNPQNLTEAERRLMEFQRSFTPMAKGEEEARAEQFFAEIKKTPEGKAIAERLGL